MDWFKFILFAVACGGSIFLGFWPSGLTKSKPAWWRWLTVVALLLLVFLAFNTPTSGTFGGLAMVEVGRGESSTVVVPVRGEIVEVETYRDANALTVTLKDGMGKTGLVDLAKINEDDRKDIQVGTDLILALKRSTDGMYEAEYVVSISPLLSVPLLPALEERARNIYFHVPVAWITQLAWWIAFAFAILYIRKRRDQDDVIASSFAAVGALFCILATTTGMVWAKFNWGSFWNWDPRQVSIFIVLIIYGAYFALRSAIPNREQRARVSSIYLILLALPVTFFIFVYPRIVPGLHPGAQGDESIGPVIDPKQLWLDHTKQVYFALGFFALTLLYFWLVNLSVRTRLVGMRKKKKQFEQNVSDRQGTGITAIDQ